MLPITGKIILSNNNQLDCFQGISVVPRRGKCRIQQVYLLVRLLADHFLHCFLMLFGHALHSIFTFLHILCIPFVIALTC